MGAALELETVTRTRRRFNDAARLPFADNLDTLGHAERCRDLWAMALHRYMQDCAGGLRSSRPDNYDNGEALDDLTGSGEMLARLCEPLGLCPEQVRAGIIERVG